MSDANLENLRYPVGRFIPEGPTEEVISASIETIESFPRKIKILSKKLKSQNRLDIPYRPKGWTGRQVIHHTADSHMNAYIRFKWTLTEDVPHIKTYKEGKWAELGDTSHTPVKVTVRLIKSLHHRWGVLLRQMSSEDFKRKLYHPEMEKELSLGWMIQLYAWHCRHHLGHLELVIGK